MGAILPPVLLPKVLTALGAATSLPFVVLCSGQSNSMGFDPGGDKTIQAGIYTTDSLTAPTKIIPAAYGTAPFNNSGGGVAGNTPSTAYNNHCIAFANNLRLSGLIPAIRPIVVIPNFHGGQSIVQWVGSGTSSPYWTELLAHLAVVESAYPGFKLALIDWWQGENDVTGTYGSFSAYRDAFATLVAQWKALPSFNTDASRAPPTIMLTHELAPFADNGNQARNDFLRTTAGGVFDPAMDMVSGGGLTESSINPGPHVDGASQVIVGQRTFAAYARALLTGRFSSDRTYWGSALAFQNALTVTTGQTLTVSPDDLKVGRAEIDSTGGTITLPPVSYVQPGTVILLSLSAFTTINAISGIQTENGGAFTSLSPSLGIYRIYVATGTWRLESVAPRVGGLQWNSISPASGSSTALSATQTRFNLVLTNGNTVTLPAPSPGLTVAFYNVTAATTLSGATMILPSGATSTSLVIAPGGSVILVGSASSWVVYGDSGTSGRGATYAPSGGSINVPDGYTAQSVVIGTSGQSGTLASAAIALPNTPRDGATVTLIAVQAVTAVTYSVGTVASSTPTTLTAGQRITLVYSSAGGGKWY